MPHEIGNQPATPGPKGDQALIELDALAEQKFRKLINSLKQATGKSLPSESEMPAKSKEELLAIITPVADKGPDAIIDALAASGVVEVKQPGGEDMGGDKNKMPEGNRAEGGNPFADAADKMPMDDARKGAVAAAFK